MLDPHEGDGDGRAGRKSVYLVLPPLALRGGVTGRP